MVSSLFDGPLQKHVILLKMVHELENRPNFGVKYDNNPNGVVQPWLARVSALVARLGVSESVNIKTHIAMASRNWCHYMNEVQNDVVKAIESLKLELELDGSDEIGKAYSSGDNFEFFADISKILGAATEKVFVIDPYFDSAIYGELFSSNYNKHIRVLCKRNAASVRRTAEKHQVITGKTSIVRKSSDLHDRLIIVDSSDVWIIGASIKDAGKKPTYLIPLDINLSCKKIEIYEAIWDISSHEN